MKFSIDDNVIITLSDTQVQILQDYISSDILENDLARRVSWVIIDQLQTECIKSLKVQWVDGGLLAANGVTMIPTDDLALAALIFSQPNYQDRKTKDTVAAQALSG